MSDGKKRSKAASRNVGSTYNFEAQPDRRDVTKKKVIERLKALSPSLLASGAIVDGRPWSLELPRPPEASRKK
jgi:hypothetical protein